MTNVIPVVHSFALTSERSSNNSLASPSFRFKNFDLKKGDLIGLSYYIPPLSNVTSALGNNTMELDTQDAGGATTTVTLETADVRFFSTDNLLQKMKVKFDAQEITDGGSATYTLSYDKYSDVCTIEKSSGNFGFTVSSGDLLNFIGFDAGAYTGAGTYTTTNSANLYKDIVCVQSNLVRDVVRGKDESSELLSTDIIPVSVIVIDEANIKFGNKFPTRYYKIKANTQINEIQFNFLYTNGTQIEVRNSITIGVEVCRTD